MILLIQLNFSGDEPEPVP